MDYRQIVRDEATKIGLDPDIAEATMRQESGGNPSAQSPVGAYGLMQLMPGTAKELGVDANDPIQNIQGGVRYLHQNIQKYGTAGGLAAYNAGPGRVQKTDNFADLPEETRKYVPSIMERAAKMKDGAAPTGATPTPTQTQAPSLEQHYGALQKAQAAGDTAAVNEISQAILTVHQGALAKANAAGDADAVSEITEAMKPLAASQPAQATQTSSTPVETPVAAPKATAKPAVKPTTPEPTTFLGKVGQGADNFIRGAADTLTFGYADEIAAKLDSLTGGGQSGKKAYDAALAAQRQRDEEGGAARTVGQVAGALVPGGVAFRAASGAGKLGRAAAAAKTGAAQGALYGTGSAEEDHRLDNVGRDAAIGGGLGLVGGVVASAITPLTKVQAAQREVQKVDDIVRIAGGETAAKTEAEAAKRAQAILTDPSRMVNGKVPEMSTIDLKNKTALKFLQEVNDAVHKLPDDLPSKSTLVRALTRGTDSTPTQINALRATQGGDEVADAILDAQRAKELIANVPDGRGLPGFLGRRAIDVAAAKLSGGLSLLAPKLLEPLKKGAGVSASKEFVTSRALAKRATDADLVLQHLGPSDQTTRIATLTDLALKAQTNSAAKAAVAKTAADAQTAADLANRNLGLKTSKAPLSGAFQPLLRGGESPLQMSQKQAIDGLRLVKRQLGNENPIGQAADDILNSRNVSNKDTFYQLQNHMQRLQEQGILGGSSLPSGVLSPKIRNQASYDQAVKQAGRAAEIADKAAPSTELRMFANTVAAEKNTAAKQKLLDERVAITTDQEELDYLKQYVERLLTRRGKK